MSTVFRATAHLEATTQNKNAKDKATTQNKNAKDTANNVIIMERFSFFDFLFFKYLFPP